MIDEKELSYRVEETLTREGPSMKTALVLWFFFAPFAAHNFYLGRRGPALVQLSFLWGGMIVFGLSGAADSTFLATIGLIGFAIGGLAVTLDLFRLPDLVRQRTDEVRDQLSRELRAAS